MTLKTSTAHNPNKQQTVINTLCIVESCDVTKVLFVTDAVYPHVVFVVFWCVSCLVYVCTWSHDNTIADCWNYACKLMYNPPNTWDGILQLTTYVCKGSLIVILVTITFLVPLVAFITYSDMLCYLQWGSITIYCFYIFLVGKYNNCDEEMVDGRYMLKTKSIARDFPQDCFPIMWILALCILWMQNWNKVLFVCIPPILCLVYVWTVAMFMYMCTNVLW